MLATFVLTLFALVRNSPTLFPIKFVPDTADFQDKHSCKPSLVPEMAYFKDKPF